MCRILKTAEFFIKSKGFHSYFERNGGALVTAISNANHTKKTLEETCTYPG